MFVLYSLFTPSPLTNVNTSTKSFSISFSTNCLPTDKNSFSETFDVAKTELSPERRMKNHRFYSKFVRSILTPIVHTSVHLQHFERNVLSYPLPI